MLPSESVDSDPSKAIASPSNPALSAPALAIGLALGWTIVRTTWSGSPCSVPSETSSVMVYSPTAPIVTLG